MVSSYQTERNGVNKVECRDCWETIYFFKNFKKRFSKFWLNTEEFGKWYFWVWMLVIQVLFFLLSINFQNARIMILDFIFSPLLFVGIIFDITLKFHKGKKFIPCFIIGEIILTFTFFFLKMVAYP